jgi:hypothetical protein
MITIIKLTNGTEIVGTVITQDSDSVTVEDPLQINYKQRMDMAPPTVFLHRFNPFAKNTTQKFRYIHILSFAEPMDGLVKYYSATLNSIKEDVDTHVDNELNEAAKSFNDEPNDIDRAMMEKAMFKPILN